MLTQSQLDTAEAEGRAAFRQDYALGQSPRGLTPRGKARSQCPHPPGSPLATAFWRGYYQWGSPAPSCEPPITGLKTLASEHQPKRVMP